jgi:hypothetical protein
MMTLLHFAVAGIFDPVIDWVQAFDLLCGQFATAFRQTEQDQLLLIGALLGTLTLFRSPEP